MRITKSGQEIRSIEDWFKCAPPKKGKLQWKDGRSAKELARCWLRNGAPEPPNELAVLLATKFGSAITFQEARPECITELDDFAGEHRNCDLVVFCNVGVKRMVINIEAKADEAFGDVIGEYLDRKRGSRSKVPERIRQLSMALFAREPDEAIRRLRYQLLHATAAALIEAKNRKAELHCSWSTNFGLQIWTGTSSRRTALIGTILFAAFLSWVPPDARTRLSAPFRCQTTGVCQRMCRYISEN